MPGRPRNIHERNAQRLEELRSSGAHVRNDNVQQINIAELRAQNPDLDAAMTEHARRNPPPPRPSFSEQQTRQMPRPSPPPFDPATRDTTHDVQQINIAELRAQSPELDAAMNAIAGVPETSAGVSADDLSQQGRQSDREPTPIRRLDGPQGPSLG